TGPAAWARLVARSAPQRRSARPPPASAGTRHTSAGPAGRRAAPAARPPSACTASGGPSVHPLGSDHRPADDPHLAGDAGLAVDLQVDVAVERLAVGRE